jgi:glycyl-tRNA synthetase beta chain
MGGELAATLVVELLTEELPPKALRRLGEAFAQGLAGGLRERGFAGHDSTVVAYATPRRLAVAVTRVLAKAPDAQVRTKLMPAKVAFADGQPTAAYRKKLESLGRPHLADRALPAADGADHLGVESDGKADYVWLSSVAAGQPLERGLQDALDEAIAKLPIPKVMRYAAEGSYYNDIAFVRPAHRLLALHGTDVVRVSALGMTAGQCTDGHRFHSRTAIPVASADAYAETLRAEGKVVASFDERRAMIEGQLARAAQGDRVVAPEALLDEVTALVEWPFAYAGTFDPAFLAVPQECLILTMQQNQKYFALTDEAGKMRARFLVVSNLEARDPARIVGGNERVLRARLADAKFFFEQDRKATLASRLPKLDAVVYLAKLGAQGSQGQRVARLARLARELAPATGAAEERAERAARLAKADLVTDMVGEFPELQGTMGRYYAQHDGESAEVADAVAQHYWPRFAGDALPSGPVAQAVALADKMEAMAGLFGVGQVPTGDKDPFGLRRAAIGVIRILVEKGIDVRLPRLIALAFGTFEGVAGFKPMPQELLAFIEERLRGWLREQGASAHQAEALLAVADVALPSLPTRLAAVQAFESLPEAATLAAANKRIVNILKKSGGEASAAVDRALLADGAERDLWLAFGRLAPEVDRHIGGGDYAAALQALATAKPAVDRFFDDVLVMADDPAIRANRLALLFGVATTMNRVADISRLAA